MKIQKFMIFVVLQYTSKFHITDGSPVALPQNPPLPPDGTNPSPAASRPIGGKPTTAAEQTNQGLFVNGFNCTQYISQCKKSSVNLKEDDSVKSSLSQDYPKNSENTCKNPQAQEACGESSTNTSGSVSTGEGATGGGTGKPKPPHQNSIQFNKPPSPNFPIISQFPVNG